MHTQSSLARAGCGASWPGEVQAVSSYSCRSISDDVRSLCYPGISGKPLSLVRIRARTYIMLGIDGSVAMERGVWELREFTRLGSPRLPSQVVSNEQRQGVEGGSFKTIVETVEQSLTVADGSMEERLQQQRWRSWSDRVRLVTSKRMSELRKRHLEKNKRISCAYSVFTGQDGMWRVMAG